MENASKIPIFCITVKHKIKNQKVNSFLPLMHLLFHEKLLSKPFIFIFSLSKNYF